MGENFCGTGCSKRRLMTSGKHLMNIDDSLKLLSSSDRLLARPLDRQYEKTFRALDEFQQKRIHTYSEK